ncbi:MAG TPA: MFS transporter [Alphaproteobacteria bacterium]|nr:MFS transporter [Alphaproteobacteria bacterium]
MSTPKTHWGIIAVSIGAGIVAAMHIGMVPPAIPSLRAELGLNLVTSGWVVSTFSGMTVAIGILAGVAADRIGYRRLMLYGLAILVLGALAGAVAQNGAELLASRLAEGLGFIAILVSAPSIIAETTTVEDRRFALGTWGTYMPTGIAFGMILAPPILAQWNWRAVWIATGALSAAWFLVVALTLNARLVEHPEPVGAERGAWWQDVRVTLAQPGVWLLAAFFAFYAAQWMALMVWLPTFLVEARHLTVGTAAWMTVAVVAVNAPGNLLGAWLLARNAPRWTLLGTSSLLTVACAFAIFTGVLPDAARYGVCLLFSFFTGVCPAAVLSGAAVFRPSARQTGATNGFLIQGSNAGQFFGPPAMAMLVSLGGGWGAGAWVFLATGSAGALLSLSVRWAEKRRLKPA